MSNQTINISKTNVAGPCNYKCAYSFSYGVSSLTVKNTGVSIQLGYDNGTTPPVTYNNNYYTVDNISIYAPSLHAFNGMQTTGELIIKHNPDQGGNSLMVCVPLIQGGDSTSATNLITQIITDVSLSAHASGDTTNININNFTLQDIIPVKPYFSYTSTTSAMSGDFIVYGVADAIPLSQSIVTTLGSIIQPLPLQLTGGDLFFNSSGPSTNVSNANGIYISCQPTGTSEEKEDVTYVINPISNDLFSNILNNPAVLVFFQVVISCIAFIILYFVIGLVFTKITGVPPPPAQKLSFASFNPFQKSKLAQ